MRAFYIVAACLVGCALIATNAHVAIVASGGYFTPHAPLTIAIAAGIIAGAICIGVAYAEGRWMVFTALILTLIAGEAWSMLTTGERIVATRDATAAPVRALIAQRTALETKLQAARAAIPSTTARLEAAQAAKARAEEGVMTKAAERGCVANCRELVNKAVDDAAGEVAAARASFEEAKRAAEAEVAEVEAAIAALPVPKSDSPFADRIGVAGWALDLIFAALASLSANGLGASLLAFGAHSHRREGRRDREAACARSAAPAVAKALLPAPQRTADLEANRFALARFRPAREGRVQLADIRASYHAWCAENGLEPLPDTVIGAALNNLFFEVGLRRDGQAIAGIDWAGRVPAIRTAA